MCMRISKNNKNIIFPKEEKNLYFRNIWNSYESSSYKISIIYKYLIMFYSKQYIQEKEIRLPFLFSLRILLQCGSHSSCLTSFIV